MADDPTRAPIDDTDDLSWQRRAGDAPGGEPGSFGESDAITNAGKGCQGVTGRQAMGQTGEPDDLSDAD